MNCTDIPAFCINLDSRPDRWARVQPRFVALDWHVTRIPGVVHTEKLVNGIDANHAGAVDSHRIAWQRCLDDGHDMVAVFEDDVVFTSDFKRVFARAFSSLPNWWGVWHFHCSHARFESVNKYLVRFRSTGWGAHGYLIRAHACEALLNRVAYHHIDTMLTSGYARVGGEPLGMPLQYALCFQDGDDESCIPVTQQQKFWHTQRLRWCR